MRLVKEDERGRPFQQSDIPWLGGHAPVLRERAAAALASVLSRDGELLPLDSSRSLCTTSVRLGEEQHCRLFMFDPSPSIPSRDTLNSLEFLGEQIGPAIYTMLLLDVIRSRAGAIERARLARELHDGVIQSLVGAELQVAGRGMHLRRHIHVGGHRRLH